ncbi:MAG: response regulator [Lachnospiraceae bacterium]|nr:response regulator [Lachnospiraceae bacterium]
MVTERYYVDTSNVYLLKDWTVTDQNGEVLYEKANHPDVSGIKSAYYLKNRLPVNLKSGRYISFIIMRDTDVYIDGELRASFNSKEDVQVHGGLVKGFYFFVPLQRSDKGKEISVYLHESDIDQRAIPDFHVGTLFSLYKLFFRKYGPTFLIYLMLLFASLVIIVAGLTLRIFLKRKIGMTYAAVGVFCSAAWLVSDSYFYPLMFGHYHFDGTLSFLLSLIMPVPYIIYMNFLQKGRYTKFYETHLVIAFVNFVLWTVLHYSKILAFPKSMYYFDIVLGLVILSEFVVLFIDHKRGFTAEYEFTAVGILAFMLLSLTELLNVTVMHIGNDGVFVLSGLIIMLMLVVFQQTEELRRSDFEKEKAIEISDAKTRFLASMSHEIRTPINSILGMNEMILRENKEGNIDKYAKDVQRSGKILLSLVNDVLDFSKIESGKLDIMEEEYSLSVLLKDVVSMIDERAANKGIELRTEIFENVPDGLLSDEVRIKQILINLLSNAVKYTDKGYVYLKVSGEYTGEDTYNLKFEVADTGRGINPDDREALFDAFQRVDMVRNMNVEGTGLGLAIVKSILDVMKGTINVESEYGKWSVFTVMIPQTVLDKTPVKLDMNDTDNGKENKKHVTRFAAPAARILAVDDNDMNLNIVDQFLKETHVMLDLCTNGKDAVEKCKLKVYDLILLDHMMPGMDGIETLSHIRQEEDSLNKETTAIVLTANAVAGMRKTYLDTGFAEYLTKPIDYETLENAVRQYLSEDKIISLDDEEDDAFYGEFNNGQIVSEPKEEPHSEFRKKLESTGMIDYPVAMKHCANMENVLEKIIVDIIEHTPERTENMRRALSSSDYETLRIEAHSIKGVMGTIGALTLSEEAKRMEFAVKEENYSLIDEKYIEFIDHYESFIDSLR